MRKIIFTLIILATPALAQDEEMPEQRPRKLTPEEQRRSVNPIKRMRCMQPGSPTYPCKTQSSKPANWDAPQASTGNLFTVHTPYDATWIGLMALGVLGALVLWVLDRKRNS